MGSYEHLVASVPLLSRLPDEEIHRLATTMEMQSFSPGEVVFNEGDRGDHFYIVQSGQIEVIKAMGKPEERLIAVRKPGEFVGEMSLLGIDGLRTASVRALHETRLWVLRRAEFNSLLHRQPLLAYEMVRVLADRLKNAHNAAISDLQEKNRQLTQAYEELKAAQAQIIEKERLERELQVAHDIQMSVLPRKMPGLPGYEFGAKFVPARSVGGDFYDFVPLPRNRVAITIGDVTDKGVPAAIFMAQVHALLRAEANKGASPRRALSNANRHLLDMNARGLFATVLYGILDGNSGEFSYARAGHDLPLMINLNGAAVLAPINPGQPLGIFPKPELDEQVLNIPEGRMLLLYTDGVTDERDPQGNLFGGERLKQAASQISCENAQQACDALWEIMLEYQNGTPQDDDITMIAVRASA